MVCHPVRVDLLDMGHALANGSRPFKHLCKSTLNFDYKSVNYNLILLKAERASIKLEGLH